MERTPPPVYQIYGITLASDFPFKNRLLQVDEAPELTFTCLTKESPLELSNSAELIYTSPFKVDGGDSNYLLYRIQDAHLLRYSGVADFIVSEDRIESHLYDSDYQHVVEILLLGGVLSFWLELQEILVLHASVVVDSDRAVAFLASNKGGKSTLAATFMQSGWLLLSDDILAIRCRDGRFYAEAGYPQMRMWPAQAKRFLGHFEDLERVDPPLSKRRVPVGKDGGLGEFCSEAKPLISLYLPSRYEPTPSDERIEITSLSGAEAIMTLARHSFIPRTVESMNLQGNRLARMNRVLRHVPLRQVSYPNGMEHLARTCSAIRDDVSDAVAG